MTVKEQEIDEQFVLSDEYINGLERRLFAGLDRGIERGDQNAVKQAAELVERHRNMQALRNLKIEIVPYSIADDSWVNMVLRMPEDKFKEVCAAVEERKRRGKAVKDKSPVPAIAEQDEDRLEVSFDVRR